MAKDRKKVLHIHSNVPGKQPSPSQLEIGEIAVNTAEGKEFLSIKNSNENNSKIVRFSSDEQMVDWMEKKEVFPYSGSIDSVDDVNNTSNLVLKFNQKAASGTPHSSDVNNGSGFTINMDKYAMIGANPSFSSVTADVINGKQFETELTDDSDAKVPTSKAVADYTEDRFVLKSKLEEDEFTISASLNDLNDRVEELENTQIEIPTSITDLDEYDSGATEFNFNNISIATSSDLTVLGESYLSGVTNIYDTLNAEMGASISNGLYVSFGGLSVSGDTTLKDALNVSGNTTLSTVDARSISADTIVARNLQEKELAISASLNDLNGRVEVLENTHIEVPTSITDLEEYDSSEQTVTLSNIDLSAENVDVKGDITVDGKMSLSHSSGTIFPTSYNTTIKVNEISTTSEIGYTTSSASIKSDVVELTKTDSEEDKTYDNVINANGITLNYNDGQTNYDTTVSGGLIQFSDDDLGRSSKLTYDTLLLNDDSVDNSTTVTMNGVTITDGENTVKVNSNGINFGGSNDITVTDSGDTLSICGKELIRLETDLTSQYHAIFDTVSAHSISADTIVARNLQEKEFAISTALNDLNDRVDGVKTDISSSINDLINLNNKVDNIESEISGEFITNKLTVNSGLTVSGNTILKNNLTVSGNTHIKEIINLGNNIYFEDSGGYLTIYGDDHIEASSDTYIYGDLEVDGTINGTVIGNSDSRLKKNIEDASYEKAVKANNLEIKQFNYIKDETNRTIYGVIAQEAEELGLNEIVYEDRKGYKAVNYNSLIMLKLAYLENENKVLRQDLIKLSERISKLEKDND